MLKRLVLKTLRAYHRISSLWLLLPIPFAASTCRYYPSCGEYADIAVSRYGIGLGLLKATKRVLKCNPWSRGGIDQP